MRARSVIVATAAMFALTGSYWTAHAQDGPVFQVSPASPDSRGFWSTQRQTPRMLSFVGALLPDMIAFAYELPVDPSEGRPQWLSDSRYDVAVTTAVPTSLPEQRRLLQTLLEERFSLVTRRISYRIPAYFLAQGPKVNLIPSQASVQDPDAAGVTQAACRATPRTSYTCIARMSMSDLAQRLSVDMQVAVLDKTGISGSF